MKFKSLLLLAATMLALNVYAEVGDTFTAMTAENVAMTFKIISEDDHTVMVGDESGATDVSIDHLTEGSITIPATVEQEGTTYQVVKLGFRAFAGCEGLTSVTVPSSVTTFGQAVFYNCKSLTTVNIPEGLTILDVDAFKDCEALSAITLPSTLANIAAGAFSGCNNLTSVTVNATTPPTCEVNTSNPVFSNAGNATLHVPSGAGEAYASAEVWNSFKEIIDPATVIQFEDATVKAICVANWDTNGDGELSYAEAGSVTGLSTVLFQNNQNIISFNEFQYFTGLTSVGGIVFKGCSGLTSVTIPASVTSIGNSTFSGCSSLTSVAIPNGVTSIGEAAFEKCSSLTSITIPESVTSIGNSAFYQCSGLTSITIPNSVTSIGSSTFSGCSSLTSVTIPESVTSIGNYAFKGCTGLTSVTIGNGVTSIGDNAFAGCSSLTSISIPNSVTSIGNYAFYGCNIKTINVSITDISCNSILRNYLSAAVTWNYYIDNELVTSLIIPEGVSAIGENALWNCKTLTSVTIPESVTSIGNSAFSECSNLTSIVIPGSVRSIGSDAFPMDFFVTKFKSNTPITYQNGIGSLFIVPDDALDTYKTAWASVADKIFGESDYELNSSKSLTLTAQVSSSALLDAIGGEEHTWEVVNLKLSGSINSYDMMIIRNKMINLWNLDLSDVTIVSNSYNYGTGTSVNNVFPDFLKNKYLNSVILPNNITSIDNNAFNGNTSLKSIVIPASVNSIGSSAFKSSAFKSIIFAEGSQLTTIGTETFLECKNLKTISLSGSLGTRAFKGCTSLNTVVLQEGTERIGPQAFSSCTALQNISFPESLTTIDTNAFEYCSSLASVVLPPNLKTINGYTFMRCSALEEVKLPIKLENIDASAFDWCTNLKEIHLPPYLKNIGNAAFGGCSNLKTIYAYMPDIITINNNTFVDYTSSTLYVPAFLYNNYYFDSNWSQFLHVLKCDLKPGDYESFYTNGDIVFDEGEQRITEDTPIAELGNQGGITVRGEAQRFDVVTQSIGKTTSASLIGDGETSADNNLPMNELRVAIEVNAKTWYFFCFPFDVETASCEYPGRYVWRYYDGEVRAANGSGGWTPVTGGILTAQKGYAFQSETAGALVVKFSNPTFGGDRQEELVAFAAENAQDASWNFVGNPYSSYYDFNAEAFTSPITVWTGSSYTAYRPGDDEIHLKPYQAFFVQKSTAEDQISFDAEQRETYRQSQAATAAQVQRRRELDVAKERKLINLQIFSDTLEADRTRVVLNEKKSRDYELDCDAAKFLSNDATAQLYSLENGILMAINERPTAGDIRLGYSAKKAGMLSISASRLDTPMLLIDTQMDVQHDLSTGSYEFNTTAGTFNSRFVLRPNNVVTAISTLADKTGVALGLQEGGIAIGGAEGKNVVVYDLAGAQVANHQGNGFIALKRGVYVISVDGVCAKLAVR